MTSSNYTNHTMYKQSPLKVSDSFSYMYYFYKARVLVNTARFFEQLLMPHNQTM